MSRLEEITAGTKAWWSSRQDDFVNDVPAALAEYTYNLEINAAALREENARLRGALLTYGHHLAGCKIPPYAEADNGYWAKECTCGYAAALSPSPAKEQTK